MRNPSNLLNWPAQIVRACLVLSVLGTLMSTDALLAEKLPSAESVLDEALQLMVPLAKVGDEYVLVEIAMRQAKIRSC